VAELVSQAMTNHEISERLVISQRTAESHVHNIMRKLGFTSRAQVAAWATARKQERSATAEGDAPGGPTG
jgi:non-specific serine/threonine protein kinase